MSKSDTYLNVYGKLQNDYSKEQTPMVWQRLSILDVETIVQDVKARLQQLEIDNTL